MKIFKEMIKREIVRGMVVAVLVVVLVGVDSQRLSANPFGSFVKAVFVGGQILKLKDVAQQIPAMEEARQIETDKLWQASIEEFMVQHNGKNRILDTHEFFILKKRISSKGDELPGLYSSVGAYATLPKGEVAELMTPGFTYQEAWHIDRGNYPEQGKSMKSAMPLLQLDRKAVYFKDGYLFSK
ncbi:hypothetical protein [Desulfobacula toluolica]|uniref:Uncharacterized protein n=1 Tax=Desulfobacula toluolica (strain DSM 7467 / Tol2) TaxID=651182 RepID=K0NT17_DESTT|nr:hypothetical protein [Desulfobacula toluolica]CCK82172.1 uncharacterized protein TOL2_C40170 [Desulfobacula toluolica Tol2]